MPATAAPTKATRKRVKYPDAVVEAAQKTRALLKSVGVGYAPNRREVAALRKLVGDGEPVSVAGVPITVLRNYVQTGEIARDKRGNLVEVANKLDDKWARGRNLAALFVVLHDEKHAKPAAAAETKAAA